MNNWYKIRLAALGTTIVGSLLLMVVLPQAVFPQAEKMPSVAVAAFRNLNPEDSLLLSQGQTIFRQPESWKDLAVPKTASFFKEIEDTIRKGGHNYIGEVILVLPKAQAEALLPLLKERLLDFEGYAGIPYQAQRSKRWYDLFDYVKVVGGSRNRTRGSVNVLQFMEPFGEYGSTFEWAINADSLTYAGINTSSLSYKGVRAVSPGNLIWRFHAYPVDGYWVFYGLGAVKAFDLFGTLHDRLSASFMGRIEAFFRHVYDSDTTGRSN